MEDSIRYDGSISQDMMILNLILQFIYTVSILRTDTKEMDGRKNEEIQSKLLSLIRRPYTILSSEVPLWPVSNYSSTTDGQRS